MKSFQALLVGSLGATLAISQTAPAPGVNEYKTGDYTLKLQNNDSVGSMWAGQRMIGMVYTANGKLMFAPAVTEPEASKAKKAFEDWQAGGKTGSQEVPKMPVTFEPDGGAVVPLQDGSIVHFSPTFVEFTQPNQLSSLPGQTPVNQFKVEMAGPNMASAIVKGSSKIWVNNVEQKPHGNLFTSINQGMRMGQKERGRFMPVVTQMTTAAQIASADPKKPANALDYSGQVEKVQKRINDSF